MKPYYQDDAVTIYHGDCREIVPTLGVVDAVVTDPPYVMLDVAWDKEDVFSQSLPDLFKIAKEFVSFFCQMPIMAKWATIANQNGHFCEHIAWLKRQVVQSYRLMRTHESICVYATGDRKKFYKTSGPYADVKLPGLLDGLITIEGLDRVIKDLHSKLKNGGKSIQRRGASRSPEYSRFNNTSSDRSPEFCNYSNAWSFLTPNSTVCDKSEKLHPTLKPVEVVKRLVEMTTASGKIILDPFAGSGTTGRAAKDLGRKAVLIEREERYCEIAAKRMAQGVLDFGTANKELSTITDSAAGESQR